MPAIVFLHRYWSFASDDFVYSAYADLLIRITCLIIIGVPFITVKDISLCWPDVISKVFFTLILSICGIMMLLDVVLSCMSGRGGIMETQKRKGVPHMLLIILILSVVELGLLCAGIYFACVHLFYCGRVIAVAFITGCGLRVFHVVLYYVWLMTHYQHSGRSWVKLLNTNAGSDGLGQSIATDEAIQREAHLLVTKSVQRSFKQLSMLGSSKCSANRDGNDDDVINSAAAIFSNIFYDVDLVTSDIVAGLLLLRWQTEQWVGSGHRVPLSLIERDSSPYSPRVDDFQETATDLAKSDWLSIHRLQRMAVLSISIYGKLFFMLMHRLHPRAVCGLCRRTSCCRSQCFGAPESSSSADVGCCICATDNCDKAAVLDMTSLTPTDFLELSFENSVYVSPYFVAVDVQTATIVVSVRGTLSFEDALVDLLCDGVRLTEVEELVELETGKRPTFIGHRGMVSSARKLFQRLLAHKAIETAKANHPDFQLVVCGHSLGAGIASFLTLLLRPMYPEVKGYAMSCPLGIMNLELANFTKPFLVSVIYGFDLFARLNVATVVDFKWRLVDALSATTVPKYNLITRGCLLFCRRCCSRYCSPCCVACYPSTTVGRDTKLLDGDAQKRLIDPKPELPLRGVAVVQASGREEAGTSGDKVPPPAINDRPSRLIDKGRRSLLRWLRSDYAEDYLIGDIQVPCSGDVQLQQCTDSTDPMNSCDLRDGMFGGRVLHLVDVDMEDTELGPGTRQRLLESSLSYTSSTGSPDSNDAFLSAPRADRSANKGGRFCSCAGPSEQGTVAVWTTHEQFRTFLVHPNMFNDHLPHNFLAAINRVRDTIDDSPLTNFVSSVAPDKVIRKLSGVTI